MKTQKQYPLISPSLRRPWLVGIELILIASGAFAQTGGTLKTQVFQVPAVFQPSALPDIVNNESIVSGPDGALWFAVPGGSEVGSISTAGTVTEFTIPTGFRTFGSIIAGPDGALWVPIRSASNTAMARLTTAGSVSQFVIDTTGTLSVNDLTVGPDGAIWIAETIPDPTNKFLIGQVGRITTSGKYTTFPVPNLLAQGIVTGPDGNLWVTGGFETIASFSPLNSRTAHAQGASSLQVIRMTPSGVVTMFDAPAGATIIRTPVPGPDGALWATGASGVSGEIFRISMDGSVIAFSLTLSQLIACDCSAFGPNIARGPDGALWFTGANLIGRITTQGVITIYKMLGNFGQMTEGPDGAMWFIYVPNYLLGIFNTAIGRFTVATSVTSALPHFAAQDIWTTGIFAVNTGNAPANFEIDFRDDTGAAVAIPLTGGLTNQLTGTLPAQGSAYFEASNPAGPLIGGWGQIKADAPVVVQALFREKSSGSYYEAAVPSNIGSQEFEIPFDATTFAATGDAFYTGFAIANLDMQNMATVMCTARDQSGTVIPNAFTASTGPPVISPLGHWAGYLFPALTGKRGTIDCSANVTIAATALRFIGAKAFSSLPVIDKQLGSPLIPGAALAHFAAQDVWTTGIFAINTGTAAANYAIAFYDDSGNPISLPFSGGTTNTLAGSLPPQGSAYFEASDPKAGLIDGWGLITADPGVVIQALFRENASGNYFEASVPAGLASTEFEIPFDATTFSATGDQFYTGFAIANLNASNPATITCTARDGSGAVIPNAFTAETGPPTLRPLGHWAGYLFPALTGKRGTIDCVSTTAIAATALRFLGSNAFSSLPVINK
jgi:virginiamycin B lyase